MKCRMLLAFLVVITGGLVARTEASPIIFDNLSRADFSSSRGVGDSPLASITVSAATTIDQIGVRADLAGTANIKFLIFNLGTNALLFSSGPQSFVDDGMSFKLSNPFAGFTLLPGITYGIGGIADVSGFWATNNSSAGNPFTQNGITASDDTNGNVANFASPSLVSSGAAMIIVQLAGTPGPTPVPEPSSLVFLGASISVAGFRWLLKKRAE